MYRPQNVPTSLRSLFHLIIKLQFSTRLDTLYKERSLLIRQYRWSLRRWHVCNYRQPDLQLASHRIW